MLTFLSTGEIWAGEGSLVNSEDGDADPLHLSIVAELKTKGAEFTKEPTTVRPGVRIAFIRGPEGVSIELLDRKAS